MTAAYDINQYLNPHSVQRRITALYDHFNLYESTAKFPQLGISHRMMRELALVSAYQEGEFLNKALSAEAFLRKYAHKSERPDASEEEIEKEFESCMRELMESILNRSRVFDVSERMAKAPSPAKSDLDMYRTLSGSFDEDGKRAANGQMMSMYGNKGDSVPSNLATSCDEDLQPMARLLREHVMDPVIDFVLEPFLKNLGIPQEQTDTFLEKFNATILDVIAEAIGSALAILSLAVAVGTLDVIQRPGLRVVVMVFFSLAYALSAQFMGPRSIPVFTLITTYFQVMNIYPGNASEQK